jgi:hypothetical protein
MALAMAQGDKKNILLPPRPSLDAQPFLSSSLLSKTNESLARQKKAETGLCYVTSSFFSFFSFFSSLCCSFCFFSAKNCAMGSSHRTSSLRCSFISSSSVHECNSQRLDKTHEESKTRRICTSMAREWLQFLSSQLACLLLSLLLLHESFAPFQRLLLLKMR